VLGKKVEHYNGEELLPARRAERTVGEGSRIRETLRRSLDDELGPPRWRRYATEAAARRRITRIGSSSPPSHSLSRRAFARDPIDPPDRACHGSPVAGRGPARRAASSPRLPMRGRTASRATRRGSSIPADRHRRNLAVRPGSSPQTATSSPSRSARPRRGRPGPRAYVTQPPPASHASITAGRTQPRRRYRQNSTFTAATSTRYCSPNGTMRLAVPASRGGGGGGGGGGGRGAASPRPESSTEHLPEPNARLDEGRRTAYNHVIAPPQAHSNAPPPCRSRLTRRSVKAAFGELSRDAHAASAHSPCPSPAPSQPRTAHESRSLAQANPSPATGRPDDGISDPRSPPPVLPRTRSGISTGFGPRGRRPS
jgi:hypothetical protein